MQAQDMRYLQAALESFIETSVHRVSHSGDMKYLYRITADDIKGATGRQRFHDSTIEEYLAFFSHNNVQAEYVPKFSSFEVHIDLNKCILSPVQSKHLSTAMGYFRAEHG